MSTQKSQSHKRQEQNNTEWLDELFELLTLCQTGMKTKIPIILFGREYWDKIINFEYLADLGLIEDEHLNLFQYADTASEAWKIIKKVRLENYKLT